MRMVTKTILVVDPDPGLGALFTHIFEEEGYTVVVAESPAEVTQVASGTSCDVVITEAFDQDEYFTFDPSFLAELRTLTGDLPVVLCSIYPSVESLRAGDFGLAEVVRKAFEIDDRQAKVNRLLRETAPFPS